MDLLEPLCVRNGTGCVKCFKNHGRSEKIFRVGNHNTQVDKLGTKNALCNSHTLALLVLPSLCSFSTLHRLTELPVFICIFHVKESKLHINSRLNFFSYRLRLLHIFPTTREVSRSSNVKIALCEDLPK